MNSNTYQIASVENYINARKLFIYPDFQDSAVKSFLEKHNYEEIKSKFQRFNHFINDFLERTHISSKKKQILNVVLH